MYINIHKCIIINLMNFVTTTILFVLNVAGDFPDLQASNSLAPSKTKRMVVTTQNLIIMIIIMIIIIRRRNSNNNSNNNKNENNVDSNNRNKSRKIANINLKYFHPFCLSARNALQSIHIQYSSYTSLTLSPTGAQLFNLFIQQSSIFLNPFLSSTW